jgi:Tol biopolymer transport system component
MKRLFAFAFASLLLAGCFPPEPPKSPAPPLDTITFIRAGDIWSMREDGSLQTQLTNTPEAESSPELSHNGTRIAFSRGERVWSMRRDGTDATQITFGIRDTAPAWSADDGQIVFVRENGIWAVNLNGTGAHELASTPDPRYTFPAWAPDNSLIAFTYDLVCCREHIIFINPDGSPASLEFLIGPLNAGDPITFDTEAAWSPDSTRMAFQGQLANGGPVGVWTADVGGGRESAVFLADGVQPEWSTGGDQIVFARAGQVWKMAEDGSGQVVLAAGSEPSWGPTT